MEIKLEYQVVFIAKAANMFFYVACNYFIYKGRCNNVIDHVSIEPIVQSRQLSMANSVSPMVQS